MPSNGRLARATDGSHGVVWSEDEILHYFPRLKDRMHTAADYLSGGESLRPISPGTALNDGGGIRAALEAGAIAYTFGGIATDADARVLGSDGPIRALYAAGEITGHFHGTAPNAVAMLRALVFGRIA